MGTDLLRAALVVALLTATAGADELAPPGTTAPTPLAVADAPPPAPTRGARLQLANVDAAVGELIAAGVLASAAVTCVHGDEAAVLAFLRALPP